MRVGDQITMTKEQFLVLAKRGLILKGSFSYYYYDQFIADSMESYYPPRRCDDYRRRDSVIPGFTLSRSYPLSDTFERGRTEPIMGAWDVFSTSDLLTVVHLPCTRISRTRALDS